MLISKKNLDRWRYLDSGTLQNHLNINFAKKLILVLQTSSNFIKFMKTSAMQFFKVSRGKTLPRLSHLICLFPRRRLAVSWFTWWNTLWFGLTVFRFNWWKYFVIYWSPPPLPPLLWQSIDWLYFVWVICLCEPCSCPVMHVFDVWTHITLCQAPKHRSNIVMRIIFTRHHRKGF